MKFMLIWAVSVLGVVGLAACSADSEKRINEKKDSPFPGDPPPSG